MLDERFKIIRPVAMTCNFLHRHCLKTEMVIFQIFIQISPFGITTKISIELWRISASIYSWLGEFLRRILIFLPTAKRIFNRFHFRPFSFTSLPHLRMHRGLLKTLIVVFRLIYLSPCTIWADCQAVRRFAPCDSGTASFAGGARRCLDEFSIPTRQFAKPRVRVEYF